MNSMQLLLLIAIPIYHSWRLCKTTADADWAMFNLAAFTGSWYGRDFADCKTPGIHLYYWLIAKLVGADVKRVKFVDHMITAAPGIIYYLLTNDFYVALVYVAIVNSPHFQSFAGNIGHLAAMLIMLTLTTNDPTIASLFLLATIFVEPKYLPAGIAMAIIGGWWQTIPLIFAGLLTAAGIVAMISKLTVYSFKEILEWIIESSITIPVKMSKYRKDLAQWMPWWTAEVLLFVLPWVVAAAAARPDLLFWMPAILYVAFICLGFTIRPYHLLPIVPFIAAAGIQPETVWMLASIEFLTAGFYLGDIWARHYRFYASVVKSAKDVGEWLKDKPGMIWVNGMHTHIYIYARKKVPYGLAEQIEINDVVPGRRKLMKEEWKKDPPKWVVVTDNQKVRFEPNGYSLEAEAPSIAVYKKVA